jgi:hypothetical protein
MWRRGVETGMSGVLNADGDPDRDAGALFMLTFAAIGELAMLDAEPASAWLSLPPAPPPTSDEARALLSAAPPPAAGAVTLSVATSADHAFLAAVAAFAPAPAGAAPLSLVPADAGAEVSTYFGPSLADVVDDALSSGWLSPAAPNAPGAASVSGDNLVIALAADVTLTLDGQNDLVLTSAGDAVHVLSDSRVALRGAGAQVTLAADDRLALSGTGFEVEATGPGDMVEVGAASQATIVGDGVSAQLAAPDAQATLGGGLTAANQAHMNSGGLVNLMDHSALTAFGSGAAYLGAQDFLSLFGAFDIYAAAPGGSVISGFGDADTLHLSGAFSDVAALLGATSDSAYGAVLNLGGGDSLTFAGVAKSQLASLAQSDHIRFG